MRYEVYAIFGPTGANTFLQAFRTRKAAVNRALVSVHHASRAYCILHKTGKFARAHAIETGKPGHEPTRIVSLVAFLPDPTRDEASGAPFWAADPNFRRPETLNDNASVQNIQFSDGPETEQFETLGDAGEALGRALMGAL